MRRRVRQPLREGTSAFYAGIVLLAGLKLWLVHDERIIGSATQFDALWYVRSATHWYWRTPYSWTAFVRPCGYPLWIAMVHLCHIPLRLAIELLQLGGAFCLTLACRELRAMSWVSLGVFAAMAFHPAGYQLNNYTMSDTLYAALLWYVLAGLISLLKKPVGWKAIATGVAFAAIWSTREEAWLAATLVLFSSLLLLFRGRNNKAETKRCVRSLALFCATAGLLILAVYSTNKIVFRSFARSEMTASTFQSLYHSLLRIRPREPKRYAPITNDTLERAYAVSPTFGDLRQQLRGPLGEAWRTETFHRTGVPNEIGVGWIVWATRSAASMRGYFQTPGRAQHFFNNASREINRACDEGRLPTRFVIDGFLDPLVQAGGVKALPRSSLRIAKRFFAQWPNRFIPDDEILTKAETALYNRMTLRTPERESPSTGLTASLRDMVGKSYSRLVIALIACALVFGVVQSFKGGLFSKQLVFREAMVLILVALLGRALLFAWLDATAFDSTDDRFLFPILPLFPVLLILLIEWMATKKAEESLSE